MRASIDKAAVVELILSGLNLEQVAARMGCTRERIRQIVAIHYGDADWYMRHRKMQRRLEKEARIAARQKESAKVSLPCIVCEGPILRQLPGSNFFRTCSSECSELWRLARFRMDDTECVKHTLIYARYILANPGSFSAYKLKWAERYLKSGSNGRPHPIYSPSPTSITTAAYERVLELRERTRQRSKEE